MEIAITKIQDKVIPDPSISDSSEVEFHLRFLVVEQLDSTKEFLRWPNRKKDICRQVSKKRNWFLFRPGNRHNCADVAHSFLQILHLPI